MKERRENLQENGQANEIVSECLFCTHTKSHTDTAYYKSEESLEGHRKMENWGCTDE